MTEPRFSIDSERLRAEREDLERIATETAQIAAELREAHAVAGTFWGDDKPGKIFGESYEPGAEQAIRDFEDLAASLRQLQAQMSRADEAFQNTDAAGARAVDNSNPYGVDAPASSPVYSPPSADPIGRYNAQPARSAPAPADPDPGGRPADTAAGAGTGASPSAADPPKSPADSPTSESPGNGPSDPVRGAPGPEQAAAPGAPGVPRPSGAAPQAAPPGPVVRGAGVPRAAAPSATSLPGAGPSPRPAPGAAANPPGTPWAKPPGRVSAPEIPPRGQPPVPPRRPDGPARPGDKKGPASKPPPRRAVATPSRPVTDDEAMRIAREMALRHGLEISGFESAGIGVPTVQAMADAVDSVLATYPAILRGIAIEEKCPVPARVEHRADHGSPPPTEKLASYSPQPWIVLDSSACTTPALFAGRPRIEARDATGALRDPMYTTMLLEFGHVLDLLGGFRARREAQRALITEYLRISGAQGETLARVVHGYKQWRSELTDYCFDHRLLSPGHALAEGFADVESHGSRASGPGKVLHRVLSVMAAPDSRGHLPREDPAVVRK
ncbi:hypothetical protein [Nocardia sp. NPDC051750]|uniref:hypothetical protein n=1 Tax=Nocardia sp. NPDC051750 TaxID=3364325 RepID=UPI0037A92A06